MMYKLLNWCFGWDYIYWQNSAASGIARVRKDGRGKLYYWRYKITKRRDEIVTPDDVEWLTCSPRKYFN
jgi:hypothetical protein